MCFLPFADTVSQSRAPTLVFDDENETISEIHAAYDPEKVIKPKVLFTQDRSIR